MSTDSHKVPYKVMITDENESLKVILLFMKCSAHMQTSIPFIYCIQKYIHTTWWCEVTKSPWNVR